MAVLFIIPLLIKTFPDISRHFPTFSHPFSSVELGEEIQLVSSSLPRPATAWHSDSESSAVNFQRAAILVRFVRILGN